MEIARVDATLGLASHPVYTTSVRLAHSASTRNFSTITPFEEAFIAFEQSEIVKMLGDWSWSASSGAVTEHHVNHSTRSGRAIDGKTGIYGC